MPNLSQEIAINIIHEVIRVVPFFEADIQQQIRLRNLIEEQLNDYEITSKSTALVTGDLLEKAFIYLSCKKLEGMALGTRKNYTLLFKRMNEYLNKPVSMISVMDLRMFLAKAYPTNQASSMNTKISNLKAFFLWLQDEGYLVQNPARNLALVKEPYRKRKAMTMEEVELMREACSTNREKAMFELMISSGCRAAEVSNADISKIKWDDRTMTVIGKGNKERTVIFSTRAKMFMQTYLSNRNNKSTYLFTASKKPFNKLGTRSIERDITDIALGAGINHPVFPHLCRHTFANTSANQNMSLPALQKLLGHSSSDTTQIYYELDENNLKNEYKKLAL